MYGISYSVVISLIEGTVCWCLLLAIENNVFANLVYFMNRTCYQRYPVEVTNEDPEVTKEKNVIASTDENVLKAKYTMATRDLTKYHKGSPVVNGISLGLKSYECFGIFGANGAGKSTIFKMLTGETTITYGDAWIHGYNINRNPIIAKKAIGYCPQTGAILDDMTCRETILMFSLIRGIAYTEGLQIPDCLAEEFDFVNDVDKKVKELSGGNKRKLSAALCLIGDPPVLFLDEPSSGRYRHEIFI